MEKRTSDGALRRRAPFPLLALLAGCATAMLCVALMAAPALSDDDAEQATMVTPAASISSLSSENSPVASANAAVSTATDASGPLVALRQSQTFSASSLSAMGKPAAVSEVDGSSVLSADSTASATAASASTLSVGDANITEVGAGAVIHEGGTYQIAPHLFNTTITIATTEPVTLIGNGIAEGDAMYLTIKGGMDGVDLTLRDLFVSNGTAYAVPALSFTGTGNQLHVEGQSILQMCYTAPDAAPLVSVPSGTDLAIDGTGELYLYRHTTDSATFGGADSCDNGAVTVNGGHLRITGMSGGVAFGTSYPGGDFTINGGDVSIDVEKGQAGIAGGKTSGNIVVNGGILSLEGAGLPIYADPADGEGTLQVNGGRLAVASSNTLPQAYAATGAKVIPYTIDLGNYVADDSAEILVDGAAYYAGSLSVTHYTAAHDARGESTPLTWETAQDENFTLYLMPTDHTLSVNGTTLYVTYGADSGFTVSENPPIHVQVSTTPAERFALAAFTCTTDATDATYRWQFLRAGGDTWADLDEPGWDTSSFVMEACTCRLQCKFRCVVTLPDGQTATSDAIGFDLATTL